MRRTPPLRLLHPSRTPGHDPKRRVVDGLLSTHLRTPSAAAEHRAQVLALYRTIVRTVQRTPPSQARDDAFLHFRAEFRRHQGESDPLRAHYVAQQGALEWKVVERYFHDMRVFHERNVASARYVPEKRNLKGLVEAVERDGPGALPGWKIVRKTLTAK